MHNDERRRPSQQQELLFKYFAANPDELFREYLDLVQRESRNADQETEARNFEHRLKELNREKAEIERKLATARSSLDAYRKETRRLKDDLKRVRGSRSMRIGRAVTQSLNAFRRAPNAQSSSEQLAAAASQNSPAHVVESDYRSGSQSKAKIVSGSESEAGNPPSTAADSSKDAASSIEPRPATKLWELSDEQLEERLVVEPAVDVLSALLNRTWFQRGNISKCEGLLAAHHDLAENLPAQGKELVARIRGAARMQRGRVSIPPRSHNAAYRVESGRVMYCVHSDPVFDSNGYSTRTRGLVEALHEAGVDISVVSRLGYPWDVHPGAAPKGSVRDVAELGGVEYVHLPGANINRDPIDEYVLKAADAYVREAKIRRPQRIHAASNFRQALAALIASRRVGVPFVYEVRGLWELTEAASKEEWERSERFALQVELENLVATEADHVLAITTQVRDELISRGVAPERITLARNAVNADEFVPLPPDRDFARSIGVTLDRPVIGFAGSLVTYEGLDILLEAVRIVRDRDINVQVVIAGSGPAAKELHALTEQLHLKDDVTFVGRVPNEDIPRLMSIVDVMPCPRLSTRVTELVSPLKPLESYAAGKVVVLSDVSPQVDLAPPASGRGFLFPAGDPEALSNVLIEVLLNPDTARAAARAGRLWVVRERTWTALSSEIRAAYESADRYWTSSLAEVPRKPLEQIRLGIIADEFTTETLSHRVQVVPISREDPLAVLDQDLDAVFIESAWEGNDGEWFRGVGHYGEEEFAALERLLHGAGDRGIPRIFWNKEDPVHIRRFLPTAVHFDHVFTTDASLLSEYLAAGESTVRTASALPFYAELSLHNPVQTPASLGAPTAMYAGTYYGDRYAARSKELAAMLRAAVPHGLTIYDRQYGKADTPYHFPQEFAPQVRGSLPYSEVLNAYRSHIVNLNVNSVTDSPTMYSRRVVEIAASGGVVLSGPGRGVVETFGGAIPSSRDPHFHRALLRAWNTDPLERFDEAWFQLRTVARAHSTETALAIMLRTAGIGVDGLCDPRYIAVLDCGSSANAIENTTVAGAQGEELSAKLTAVVTQSVKPVAIAVPREELADVQRLTELTVITPEEAQEWLQGARAEALVDFTEPTSRTFAEDLLIAHRFRGDTTITAREFEPGDDSRLLAAPADQLAIHKTDRVTGTFTMSVRADKAVKETGVGVFPDKEARPDSASGDGALSLIVPPALPPTAPEVTTSADESVRTVPPTIDDTGAGPAVVLIAGHDLKFLAPYIADLEEQGHTVLIDQWTGHSGHDEEESRSLLAQADVVWCEWGLGNAVWYSEHISSSQRLVVRVHLQEIDLPYLRRINMDSVDAFVFVGELIRRSAIEGHGVPSGRTVVVPNFVRTDALARPKTEAAAHTLGLVGIVPQRKRLDLAVDLVEALRENDSRYRLRIKGKRPEEYSWMDKRPEEMQFYREQFDRIDRINEAANEEVIGFDPHGPDMAEWYTGIGTAISLSDFESFHLTLADGAASGADAVSLAWDGADLIYPDSVLYPDVATMAAGIFNLEERNRRERDLGHVVASFDEHVVYRQFTALLFGKEAGVGQPANMMRPGEPPRV
ncbi:glycosyltransferase [Brevibacterium casei]